MKVNYDSLPEYMRSGTKEYIEHGVRPGSFLQAVICNDLFKAVVRADYINKSWLKDWVLFFHNEAPRGCYGSKEKMDAWINAGGNKG